MSQDPTRSRLLESAGQEFAEKGFELARVRAICERAGANLAAVNYHFGDKEGLYRAVLCEAHFCNIESAQVGFRPDMPPAERLRAFIYNFMNQVLAMRDEDDWKRRLTLREMLAPTPAGDDLVRDSIRPRFEFMKSLMREICPGADDRRLHALVFSVIGQCLHYKVARQVTMKLIGEEAYRSLDLDYVAEHITSFCLAALGKSPALDRTGEVPSGNRSVGSPS